MFQFVHFRIISHGVISARQMVFVQIGTVSYQFAQKWPAHLAGNLFSNIIKVSN